MPLLENGGDGQADSVVVILHARDFSGTVLDSVAVVGLVDPDRIVVAGDSIVLGASSIQELDSLVVSVEVETHYLQRPLPVMRAELSEEEGGGGGGTPISDLRVHATAGGLEFTWNPPYVDPAYYVVFLADESGTRRVPYVSKVSGVTRVTIRYDELGQDLLPLSPSGERLRYRAAVSACTAVGLCTDPIVSEVVEGPWLPELTTLEGWPKNVPGGATVPPRVIELSPTEQGPSRAAVFVGGRDLYAWFLDTGEPVDPDEPSGLFYEMPYSTDPKHRFVEALGWTWYIDEQSEDRLLVLGNRAQDGLYAIEVTEKPGGFEGTLAWGGKKDIVADLSAPVVFNFNRVQYGDEMPQVAIVGRDNPDDDLDSSLNRVRDPDTLYVWNADGTAWLNDPVPPGVSPGAYGVVPVCPGNSSPGPSVDNWRSLAVYFDDGFGANSHLVQTTRLGDVMTWHGVPRSLGALATPDHCVTLSQAAVSYRLSSPSVGNVTSTVEPNVVLTSPAVGTEGGHVWALSIDLSVVAEESDPSWYFQIFDGNPLPRPVLVCEAGDFEQTIVTGGGGGMDGTVHQTYVLRYNDDRIPPTDPYFLGSALVDGPPLPSRGDLGIGEVLQEPVVLELDGDGSPEVLAGTITTGLYAWDLESGEAEVGWPVLFSGIPLTPAVWGNRVFVADGTNLHGFRLESGGSAIEAGWSQYGNDRRAYWVLRGQSNWSFQGGPFYCDAGRPHPGPAHSGLQIQGRDGVGLPKTIQFQLESPSNVEVAIYDAGGRRIRELVHRNLPAGRHALSWDGRNDREETVGSGVFFVQMRSGGERQSAKMVVLR